MRVSQTHAAVPAVLAAAGRKPLRAALDAVWHVVRAKGERYSELLAEIRAVCGEQSGEQVSVFRTPAAVAARP
ncbi:hypothetical protein [Streptomyces spiramenti]|uniref:Uncharacterized protein n=1 Tax=Streptomyces spiramenti TaxID=2720606 RepID=A0ABX1AN38_9ACTN|nr:hypothetical protein [Streptomyces spiramenti]NJP67690.1 hypothetical protein [Streptomyces spiramenti]